MSQYCVIQLPWLLTKTSSLYFKACLDASGVGPVCLTDFQISEFQILAFSVITPGILVRNDKWPLQHLKF